MLLEMVRLIKNSFFSFEYIRLKSLREKWSADKLKSTFIFHIYDHKKRYFFSRFLISSQFTVTDSILTYIYVVLKVYFTHMIKI